MSEIMSLKGVNGQVVLLEDRVIIKRKGAMASLTTGFFSGDKELHITSISGIQFKEATLATNGFIQFTISGEGSKGGSILDKTKDENTVMFKRGLFKDEVTHKWVKLKEKVQSMVNEAKNLSVQPNVASSADELKKFAELKDQGVISEQEFDAKKKELLGL